MDLIFFAAYATAFLCAIAGWFSRLSRTICICFIAPLLLFVCCLIFQSHKDWTAETWFAAILFALFPCYFSLAGLSVVGGVVMNRVAYLVKTRQLESGWALLLSGGFGCLITSCLVYWWACDSGRDMVGFLSLGVFCAPLCLCSCNGFIQLVSGMTGNRLHNVWGSLPFWRRLFITLFVLATVLFLVLFFYFLLCMSPLSQVVGGD